MSNGPIFLWQFQYQTKTQPVPAKEDIARLEWTTIWCEPVRIKPALAAHQQQFLAFAPQQPAPLTGTGVLWYSPWSSVMVQNIMLGEG